MKFHLTSSVPLFALAASAALALAAPSAVRAQSAQRDARQSGV